jgi:hypothetical protein
MIGLAILIPLAGTDALPHRLSWVSVPEPPRALPHQPAQAAPRSSPRWSHRRSRRKGWCCRRQFPPKAAIIRGSRFHARPRATPAWGCRGRLWDSNGPGNGVIDGLLAPGSAQPPPLARCEACRAARAAKAHTAGRRRGAKQAHFRTAARLPAAGEAGAYRGDRAAGGGHLARRHDPQPAGRQRASVADSGGSWRPCEQWVFRPTSLNGDAVEVATEIEVHFTEVSCSAVTLSCAARCLRCGRPAPARLFRRRPPRPSSSARSGS